MLRTLFYTPQSKMGRRIVISVLVVFAIVIGLLVIRPWAAPHPDDVVTVQRGESIQAAIDAAEAGDVIFLVRGEFNESIVIDKPLTLQGSGVGRTAIDGERGSGPVVEVLCRGTGPIDVKIEELTITGSGLGSIVEISSQGRLELKNCAISGRHQGVQVSDSARIILTGCTVSDSAQRALTLTDSARASITDSRIEENGRFGLWLDSSAQATLSDSEVSDNGDHSFWLRDEARVELTSCSISGNRGHGVWLMGQSEAQLLKCQVTGNSENGILVEDSARVEMTDSKIVSSWHGIELFSEARATLTGSTVSQSIISGISVQHSAHITISASNISDNIRGVWLRGEVVADIIDSLIEENELFGIYSRDEAEVTGGGNRFRGNGVDLVGNLPGALRMPLREPVESKITWPDEDYDSLQEALDALVPGGKLLLEPGEYTAGLTVGKEVAIEAGGGQVTLRGKSDELPVLSLVDGADLHLSGVSVSGGSEGLLISGAARAVLVNCTVYQNWEGINLSHSSSVELVACRIAENERRGIFAGGEAQVAVVRCTISGNHEAGVAATDFAGVTISDSMVTGNRGGGILLWGSCRVTLEGNTITENSRFGVSTNEPPCFPTSRWSFHGSISGSANTFEGNRRGDVCPPELEFLGTAEGGEMDLLP